MLPLDAVQRTDWRGLGKEQSQWGGYNCSLREKWWGFAEGGDGDSGDEVDRFTCAKVNEEGFPGGAVVENLPANAEDTGSSPGLGRSHMPQSD